MRYKKQSILIVSLISIFLLVQCNKFDVFHHPVNKPALAQEGKEIFRFDTYDDEAFWTDVLHIDKAIAGSANGGFGPGVSPRTALAVGLKVDAKALPADVVAGIKSGAISL